MSIRSKNSYQKLLYDFMEEVFVVCPYCSGKAIVRSNPESIQKVDENITRVVCPNCGFSKMLKEVRKSVLMKTSRRIVLGRIMRIGGSGDPYFWLPLWLKADCLGLSVWAFNYEHLKVIKEHIQAEHRQRDLTNVRNKSIGSRLPKWMTAANNRKAVLKTIELLEKK